MQQESPPSTAERVAAPTRTAAAFYALSPGSWRDYWTLLHPPYTAWHLSYVLLGASLAPAPDPRIVAGALLPFSSESASRRTPLTSCTVGRSGRGSRPGCSSCSAPSGCSERSRSVSSRRHR